MRPFALEAFKRGDIAITRRGDDAHFVYHDPLAVPDHRLGYRVIGFVFQRYEDGRATPDENHHADLIGMKPKTRKEVEIWLNVYSAAPEMEMAHGYRTESRADECASEGRLGGRAHRVVITIEE